MIRRPAFARVRLLLLAWTATALFGFGAASAADPASLDFNRDIRLLLSDRCFSCHGPDSGARQAKLRLDRRDDALGPLPSGAQAIVPGRREVSELYRRVTSDDAALRMPPADSGKSLTLEERERLGAWIDAGAPFVEHWSLAPPRKPEVPDIEAPTSVDAFLLARLARAGVEPAPSADRGALIRRLSLDLRGLPPEWEEVEAFRHDARRDAYERVVDRYLASPQFGERLAVYWLDLVRYADTVGYHGDQDRSIAAYRDYVIDAFNADLPFDQFTIEQLAGDLLPGATVAQRVASGYNMLGMTTIEGGAQAKEYLAKYAADRVRNASGAWLGATLGCAECHDHKYDPYAAREFYQFAAFFADLRQEGVGEPIADLLLPTPQQTEQLERIERELGQLPAGESGAARREQLEAEKKTLRAQIRKTIPSVAVAPRPVRILPRGNWLDESGEVVAPATPACLPPLGVSDRRATRLDLARWLVNGRHPQTARVFVNRMWKLLFGAGLSRTLNDCGVQGEWPSHPELLDWLGAEFVENGWSVKRLFKRLVTTDAYRRSSRVSNAALAADPSNRLFGRQTRTRLDAEFIRDHALAVSGLLVPRIGGDSVKPYQPAGYYAMLNFPPRDYVADVGPQQYRRGLYTHWQRTYLHPALIAFDAPSREECTAERPVSIAPQAALVLLNDPSFVEAGRGLGERMLREGGDSPEVRIAWAWRRALAREPRPRELATLVSLWQSHERHFREAPQEAEKLFSVGQRARPADLDGAELAAATSVARAILNLDETISRE